MYRRWSVDSTFSSNETLAVVEGFSWTPLNRFSNWIIYIYAILEQWVCILHINWYIIFIHDTEVIADAYGFDCVCHIVKLWPESIRNSIIIQVAPIVWTARRKDALCRDESLVQKSYLCWELAIYVFYIHGWMQETWGFRMRSRSSRLKDV